MQFIRRSISLVVGVTVFTVSGYLLYMLFKQDDDDEYDGVTVSKNSYRQTVELRIPKDAVGVVIGRNGQNIKSIQESSNTYINFKDRDEKTKICMIKGTRECCIVAENLIKDLIKNEPVIECEDVWVPIKSVGKIIGRCGEKINEIRVMSGAKLIIQDDDKEKTTKRISIKGTKEQIVVAKSLVDEIVDQCLEMQAKMDSILAKREPRGPLKNGTNIQNEAPKKEKLPESGQPNTQFEVYVSAVVTPSKFWVQIVGPKASELDMLVEEMTEYYNKEDNRNLHVLDSVKVGDLVAGIFQYDNKWYRAEVISVNETENSADLYYVDYGDQDTVNISKVYELRTDFLSLNFQAIQCHLAKVLPVGDDWTTEAIDKFEELSHTAQWKKLSAKVSGYTNPTQSRSKRSGSPVPCIDLVDVSEEKDINVAEELVRSGLAIAKPEDLQQVTKEARFRTNRFELSPPRTK
ncbi:tudor and KH domain-containing protein homolog [Aethina tumida]|uniref:tudor and KH domain-containing protein homolog n=1 Tax=Aethina tumida TaxID=116153 RepID=UPI002147D6D7|nr:tudor and KH domain-containing protein homolog [Aethina tumida]